MEDTKIKIDCLPLSHLCHVGEQVCFHISADREIPLEVELSVDAETILQKCTVTPPAALSASLPFPGFLRCSVSAEGVKKECAVGVDPEQIRPLVQEPEDFDLFWENAFKEQQAIPEDFRMVSDGSFEGFDIFRIDCATVNDRRSYAFLALPRKENSNGKVPLRVMFGGGEAWVSGEDFRNTVRRASGSGKTLCAFLFFHLPPYPPEDTCERAQLRHARFLEEIGLKRYVYYGLDSPRKFYLYPAILGELRLLEIVAQMPEINKEAIVYSGASHGGAFGLYFCCFSKLIKAAFCGVPNFGDVAGILAGRHQPDCNAPEFREYIETRKYFDTSYCARRITCPVYIGVGFVDNACAPSAVYAIYNNLAGPKMIFNKINNGHGDSPPEYKPMWNLWLEEHIKAISNSIQL